MTSGAPQDDLAELERMRDEICRSIERLARELELVELRLLQVRPKEDDEDRKPGKPQA